MPRLETLSEVARQVLVTFPCLVHETAPWTPLHKPLAQSTLALVTTAGLHRRGDVPFITDPRGGDASFRIIPAATSAGDILQSHASIGFDHTAFYNDINVTFPIDRLRELQERGVIGQLASDAYSFMGAIRNPRRLQEETGPEVARQLKAAGVDAVLLTPT
ncbi:MAG: hypothetical protein FJZ47_08325 [Candidatus Tectomicrobia bacterium]|uniref:Selenoprotein B glycine/betaine/sarcosine/D-proline reductase n=1 Tax=Tectimicrobiota bacterium TaxID=2528274 RepID=A0A937VZ11_UNCTE|nr:hypothetical protein [Candidatus Tectomicrobia bacterium]